MGRRLRLDLLSTKPMLEPSALRLIAKCSLDAPAYPKDKVRVALHMNGCDAPIPALDTEEMRAAVRHSVRAISAYRAQAATQSLSEKEQLELYIMRYQASGCYILQHDLKLALLELELLAKLLRPLQGQSHIQAQLNAHVLGTLTWLTNALGDANASHRYATWRTQLST